MSATKPTLAALETLFGDKAAEALAILNMTTYPLIERLENARPLAHAYRSFDHLDLHELRLEALDQLLDGSYGVDRYQLHRSRGQRAVIHSINTGDTYSLTLCRVWTQHDNRVSYRVTTWGDEIERLERLGYRNGNGADIDY
jgi:hypothetical protein